MSEKNAQVRDSGSEALTKTPEAPAVPKIVGTPVHPELRLGVVTILTGQSDVPDVRDTTGYSEYRSVVTLVPAAACPYGGWFDDIVDALIENLQEVGIDPVVAIEKVAVERDEFTLFIACKHLLGIACPLCDGRNLRFELCLSASGVHCPELIGRELYACVQFISLTHGERQLRLQVVCSGVDLYAPSFVSFYLDDDWRGRGTRDPMGIVLSGHPHLTRTAMSDDWVSHPQCKSYLLDGVPVEYKSAQTPPVDTRRSYH